MISSHKLLLIDGNSLLYRAYYAFPPFTTPKGEPIGAVYGFCRILLSAIRNLKPTHIAVSFDLPEPTFRHEMYAEYKSTRQKMEDELAQQIPRMYEVVEHLEIPIYTAAGFEADDVLGSLAQQAEMEVIILTSDQDMIQLVNDRVSVYSPAVGQKPAVIFDPAKVIAKYGFTAAQMVDYKALRGDASDNIPGVPGIGEVTAKLLLDQAGTMEKVYRKIDSLDIKPGIRQKLKENQELAELSYELATINRSAPIQFKPEGALLELLHPEKLIGLFQELGFKSLIGELPKTHKLLSVAAEVFAQDTEPSESEEADQDLAPVLRKMESSGVKVNIQYLAKLESEFENTIVGLKKKLFDLAGEEFNPDSPQQISHILYDKLLIPTGKVRKGKNGFSTNAAVLQELAKEYPIAQIILDYRRLAKLLSTYVKPLQELVDAHQRVHTSYAPDTATGRISSKNPNLQNIPARSIEGMKIRQAFIPADGYLFLSADYSQIELRVAAHLSEDPVMLQVFKEGGDFHAETAKKMGVDRRTAKVINFSILYGKGAFGFSQDMGISVTEAKEYIEQYYKTFAGLRIYLDKILEDAREKGYTETAFGRKRYFPDLNSSNYLRKSAAEREAVNHPFQGSAADILKKAMLDIDASLKNGRMILTVHDELVLEVKPEDIESIAATVTEKMVGVVNWQIPLEVTLKKGLNWAEMEAI